MRCCLGQAGGGGGRGEAKCHLTNCHGTNGKNGVYNGGTDWSQEIGIEGRNIVGFLRTN